MIACHVLDVERGPRIADFGRTDGLHFHGPDDCRAESLARHTPIRSVPRVGPLGRGHLSAFVGGGARFPRFRMSESGLITLTLSISLSTRARARARTHKHAHDHTHTHTRLPLLRPRCQFQTARFGPARPCPNRDGPVGCPSVSGSRFPAAAGRLLSGFVICRVFEPTATRHPSRRLKTVGIIIFQYANDRFAK